MCKLTNYEFDNNHGGFVTVAPPSIVQGSPYIALDAQPLADGKQFAVDCFTWLISVFGNALEARQAGLCIGLWDTLKEQCAVYVDNKFAGFGYSFTEDGVIFGEWTLGAIFAARSMLNLYSTNATIVSRLQNDINDMNATIISMYTSENLSVSGTGIFYANKYYVIPFGWMSQRNASMASTTWQIYNLLNFNPFNLDGSLDFVVP